MPSACLNRERCGAAMDGEGTGLIVLDCGGNLTIRSAKRDAVDHQIAGILCLNWRVGAFTAGRIRFKGAPIYPLCHRR